MSAPVLLGDLGGVRESTASTSTHTGLHTDPYAPPDQVLPVCHHAQRQWDDFALAVTVHEVLVGCRPRSAQRAGSAAVLTESSQLLRIAHVEGDRETVERLRREPLSSLVQLDLVRPTLREEEIEALREAVSPGGGGRVVEALVPAL